MTDSQNGAGVFRFVLTLLPVYSILLLVVVLLLVIISIPLPLGDSFVRESIVFLRFVYFTKWHSLHCNWSIKCSDGIRLQEVNEL